MKKFNLIIFILFAFFIVGTAYGQAQKAYIAEINEMNPELTKDEVSGQAIFTIANGQLSIIMVVKGLPPNMMHLQHIHGFISGEKGSCAPAEADTNKDGVIDLIETHAYSGKTLVPFNGAPIELAIKSDSYPVADVNGLITYTMTVSLDELEAAIQKKYGIDQLSLEDRVIFIHGIPEEDPLPATVQSLPGVPAFITVPIACGTIKAL